MATNESLFERAQRVIPGGVNSPVRAFKGVGGTPRFIARGRGAHLTDVDGKQVSLDQYKGKTVVLEWHNPACPFVVKHYESGNMQKLQKELTGQGAVELAWKCSVTLACAPGG